MFSLLVSNLIHSLTFNDNQPPLTPFPIYSHIHLFLAFFLDCLTLEHGTNMLSQDDGYQLPTYMAYHHRKA